MILVTPVLLQLWQVTLSLLQTCVVLGSRSSGGLAVVCWGITRLAQDQEFEVSLWSCGNRCIIYHGKVFLWAQCILSRRFPWGLAGLRPDAFMPQQPFPGCRSMFDVHDTRKAFNEEDALFKPAWNKVLPISSSCLWIPMSPSPTSRDFTFKHKESLTVWIWIPIHI